jgi:hypothetical protein
MHLLGRLLGFQVTHIPTPKGKSEEKVKKSFSRRRLLMYSFSRYCNSHKEPSMTLSTLVVSSM